MDIKGIKLFHKAKDGGEESNVTGFFLIEWKRLFSIVFLVFDEGSREAYHSHAFNSVSWLFKGELLEDCYCNENISLKPSIFPIFTSRSRLHKVFGISKKSYILSFRGPWKDKWHEVLPNGDFVTLTNGRKIVDR